MPLFRNELTAGDLIQAIAVLLAAAGLVFSAFQTRRANRQSRAQQIIDLHGRFLSDPALVDAYYKIEYQGFEYGDGFHGSELEKQIDRLLQCFENIATLVDAGVLEYSDLDPVAYNYLVIYQDAGIQRYFKWLDEWYVHRGMNETPFGVFRSIGEQLQALRYRGARPSNPYQPSLRQEHRSLPFGRRVTQTRGRQPCRANHRGPLQSRLRFQRWHHLEAEVVPNTY